MQTATTTGPNGEVISNLDTVPTATISFGRTVTFPDTFGAKEECSIFLQVPLVDGVTPEAITKQIESASALAKAYVYGQLGLEAEVTPNGVVTAAPQVGQPKTTAGKGGARKSSGVKKSAGANPNGGNFKTFSDEEREEGWTALASATVEDKGSYLQITAASGETIYDNRESKRSPNGPDFKFKDSELPLWEKDAPEWFQGPGEGV